MTDLNDSVNISHGVTEEDQELSFMNATLQSVGMALHSRWLLGLRYHLSLSWW